MFLMYVATVSDNLHNLAVISLMILSIFVMGIGWMPLINSDQNIFQKYIFPNWKIYLLLVTILVGIFIFTPSHWRYDMNDKYIEENSKLRQELRDMTLEYNKCVMGRGEYSASYDQN